MHRLSPQLLRRSWRTWASSEREGPPWLQMVWTALFAVPCALLFTLIGFVFYARGVEWGSLAGWWYWFRSNLVISLVIGFTIHGLYELLARTGGAARVRRMSRARQAFVFSALPLAGVVIGWPLGICLLGLGARSGPNSQMAPNANLGFLLFALMFSLLMFFYFGGKARVEQANRRAAEARLRLLQGQIEPHFLFNTLANVVGLIDADPTRARRTLESFVDYLRASLGGLRGDTHTLGQEITLIDAYLSVLALRMDERLRVRIEVPPDLRALPLPALLVQPLVENAIHHGLEPKVEGGEVQVRAQRVGRALLIEVIDDGLGLGHASGRRPGAGTALANLRERLQATYGDGARLKIENRPEGGVRACLELPWTLPTAS